MTSASAKVRPREDDIRRVANSLNRVIEGRTDNYSSVTLRESQTTTTVTNQFISENSTPVLTPLTANAAAEIANGTMYISARANGSFVITHANNAQTDRTFAVAWIG